MSETFVAVTPGPDLSEADHALLVRVAWGRARARMLAALALIALAALVFGGLAVLYRTLPGDVVAVFCLVVLVAAVVTAVRMPARAHGLSSLPLMAGDDRAKRRQVLRAIRRGTPLTGRLGVLADDCARRIVRRRGVPMTYGVLALGMLVAAALSPILATPLLSVAAAVAVGGVGMVAAASAWVVLIGQARRFLAVRG